jgi:putative ABC transport system permease protein
MIFERRIPFFLLSRQLKRGNKWTLAFVILLMSVAFINLVFINSLFNGIVETANNQVIKTNGNITIAPVRGQEFIDGVASMIPRVEAVRGVTAASPHTVVPAAYTFGDIQNSYQTIAVDPELEKKTTIVSERMISGSYLSPGATDQIVIGRLVAGGRNVEMNSSSLKGARVGDTVTLSFDSITHDFKIVGIFYAKNMETDRTAFISARSLAALAPFYRDRATSIVVRTEEKGDENAVIAELKAAGIPGTFSSWSEQAGPLTSVTSSFVTINALLTTVGFIIAAIVIFIIIYVDISNRRRQIGILRAIGIKRNIVISTYILQSTVYSVVGVVVGSIIFFAVIISYFKVHPFKLPLGDVQLYVNWVDFLARGAAVIAVSIISGLIPAILATRGNILDEIVGR